MFTWLECGFTPIISLMSRLSSQHTFGQGEHVTEAILNIGPALDSGNLVRVRWAGFDEDEDTWQPLTEVHDDAL